MIKELIKIADELDKRSLLKEADLLDNIIKKALEPSDQTDAEAAAMAAAAEEEGATETENAAEAAAAAAAAAAEAASKAVEGRAKSDTEK